MIKKDTQDHTHEPLQFPRGFLWGCSTSAYQIEGGNINNDWYLWEQRKGHIANHDVAGRASDHYYRYAEDFEIAAKLHNKIHRLSIEWSRIEPKEGEWDWSEIEHYRLVLKELHKRKMKVMLTLHHFTNPTWLAKRGGWLHADTPKLFARYAEFLAEHLGDLVDFWITINEPMVYAAQSYGAGVWPPQRTSKWLTWRVVRNMAKAHRLAYREIHAEMHKQHQTTQVGIAKNTISFVTASRSFMTYVYVRLSEYIWNDYFFSITKRAHDFIGINYYFHQRIIRDKNGKFIFVDVKKEQREHSDLGWEVFAPGLYNVVMHTQQYGLPMYITENGIATTNDEKRARFIVSHLKELYHAIQAGADVRGYLHWSLIDNFEWDKGFTPRFGLVEIDYATMKRTVRPSAEIYARICRENAIDHELLRFIGHGSQL